MPSDQIKVVKRSQRQCFAINAGECSVAEISVCSYTGNQQIQTLNTHISERVWIAGSIDFAIVGSNVVNGYRSSRTI
jgi:hypothetical protein